MYPSTPTPPPLDWKNVNLATDEDISSQESRMPDAAKQVRSKGGFYAYDGKRDLAKRDIEAYLRRRNTDPNYLTDPTQLNRAAVFLELAYIYRDMANRNDTVSADKAKYYQERYEDEIETVLLDYSPPSERAPSAVVRPDIALRRT